MSSQHFLAVFYFLFIYTSLFGQAIDRTLSPHDKLFINSVTLTCQEELTPLQNTNFRIIYDLEKIKIAFALKQISSPTKNSTDDYWFFFHFTQMPLDLQKRIYIFIAPQTNYILTFENIETNPVHLAFQYNDNYRIYPSFPLKLGITNIRCACFIGKTRIRKRHTTECTKTALSKTIFPISDTLLKPDIRYWTPSYEYENECPDISIINGYSGRSISTHLLINPFINQDIQSKDILFYLDKKYQKLLIMDFLNDPENNHQSKTFAFQYPLISAHILQLDKLLIECIDEIMYSDQHTSLAHDKNKPTPSNHLLAVYSIAILKDLESNNTNKPISISLDQALYTYRLPINSNCSNDYTLGTQDGPEVCNVAFTHNQKIYLAQKNDFERFFVFNILERDNIDLIISLAHNNATQENSKEAQASSILPTPLLIENSSIIINQESYTISHYKDDKKSSDFSFSSEKASDACDFVFLEKTILPFILNRFSDQNNTTILTMDLMKHICKTANEIIETRTTGAEKDYTKEKLGHLFLNTIDNLHKSKDINDFIRNQKCFIATIKFIATLYNVYSEQLEIINPLSIESDNEIINQNQKICNFELYFQTPNKSLIKFEEVDQPEDITKLNKNEIELNKAIQNAFINIEKVLTIIFDKQSDKSIVDVRQEIISYIKEFLLIPHFEQDNFSSLEKAMQQNYSDYKNLIEIVLPLQSRDFLLISNDTDTDKNYNKKIRNSIHNVFKFFYHIGSSKHIPDAIVKHRQEDAKMQTDQPSQSNESDNKSVKQDASCYIEKHGLQKNKNEISSALLYELKKYNKLWLTLLANAVKERRAIWENKSFEQDASSYIAESLQQGTKMQPNKPSKSDKSENKNVEQDASCYSKNFFLLRFIFFIARSMKYISSIFFFNRLYSNSIFNLLCQLF